ncbi:hypothetical protein M9H77_27276 [Catharanthus roseus]|uniref:Uncharacterized protein n=1 Tax=Catharanthus roseus TaxID=4058 RepID=A0ACC0AC13_CATRO|nr:hypothetical protein M9H77_27276 [Catharanthus roseus]
MQLQEDVSLPSSRKRTRDNHGDESFVVTITIDQCLVKRIMVDTGHSINVLFKETFQQMGIPWNKVTPYVAPLVGFTGQIVKLEGKVTLPISVKDTRHMKAKTLFPSTRDNGINKYTVKTRITQTRHLRTNLLIGARTKQNKCLDTWILNTDEYTGPHTRGVGFTLEDPQGQQYAYAIKFLFHVSNNKAKYEALLVGLRMARSLKLTHLLVRNDSQVVIG